jgi:hypothetical protein
MTLPAAAGPGRQRAQLDRDPEENEAKNFDLKAVNPNAKTDSGGVVAI